jgi:hypothetical protein
MWVGPKNELEGMQKEKLMAKFKVLLSQYLPGQTVENYDKPHLE